MEKQPKHYDKTCMRCPDEANIMCFQDKGKREIYDKINMIFIPEIAPIEECPIRTELFKDKKDKEVYLPPSFVPDCRENNNACQSKCEGPVVDVYVKGKHVLTNIEDGKIIDCPIFKK